MAMQVGTADYLRLYDIAARKHFGLPAVETYEEAIADIERKQEQARFEALKGDPDRCFWEG